MSLPYTLPAGHTVDLESAEIHEAEHWSNEYLERAQQPADQVRVTLQAADIAHADRKYAINIYTCWPQQVRHVRSLLERELSNMIRAA